MSLSVCPKQPLPLYLYSNLDERFLSSLLSFLFNTGLYHLLDRKFCFVLHCSAQSESEENLTKASWIFGDYAEVQSKKTTTLVSIVTIFVRIGRREPLLRGKCIETKKKRAIFKITIDVVRANSVLFVRCLLRDWKVFFFFFLLNFTFICLTNVKRWSLLSVISRKVLIFAYKKRILVFFLSRDESDHDELVCFL